MKIEKLVRIKAKSECMDIDVVMTSKKATSYVKKLSKIQEESKSAQQTAAPCERLPAVGVNFVFSQVLDFEGGRAG